MTELVVTLGFGKGTWEYVKELILKQEWERVVVVTTSFGAERFSIEGKELAFIVLDDRKTLPLLVDDLIPQLKGKLIGPEVALNMVSGEGKVHMALLSGLLKQGFGIRLVGLKGEAVEEI